MRRLIVVLVVATVGACGGSSDDGAEVRPTTTGAARASTTVESTASTRTESGAASSSTRSVPTDPEPVPPSTTTTARAADDDGLETLVPPPGRYVYDTSGFTEAGSGPTAQRRDAPPETVDEITVSTEGRAVDIKVLTRFDENEQEARVRVAESEARLTRLVSRDRSATGRSEFSLNPEPPVLLARLPYRVDDRWEIAWQDEATGLQGVGTGEVLGREAVSTGTGKTDTFVIRVEQRLRGAISGRLVLTAWIDPATGVQVKQHTISETDGPNGGRSETTRVLRQRSS